MRNSITSWVRRSCIALAAIVALSIAMPPGQQKPIGPNEFPLVGLWELMTTRPSWASDPRPTTPRDVRGGPTDVRGQVATEKTRADGGNGRAPGKGAGELGEYKRPEAPKPKTSTTSPLVGVFDEKTSQRIASGATKTSDLYRNADGSITRRVATQPTNYKAPDGSWRPIDTSLIPDGKGRYRVAASGVQVSVAANSAKAWAGGALAAAEPGPSQGGPSELVTMTLPTGQVFGYSLQDANQVAPVITTSTAIYRGILPRTDVEVTAFGGGGKETIVLHSKDAASSWLFPLRLQGLTARLLDDGSIALFDSGNKQVASIPHGYMQDSKFVENEGDFVKSDAVGYELVETEQGTALRVTADRKWLDDPGRVYPVRIDPTTTVSTDGDVHVDPDPNTGPSDQNGTSIAVGWDGGRVGSPLKNDIKVAYLSFGDFASATGEHPSLAGMRIQSAWLNLYHTWTPSGACNTYRPVYVHPVLGPWTVSGLQNAAAGPGLAGAIGELMITNNTPACTNTGGNRSTGRWVSTSIQDLRLFNAWAHGVGPNYGLGLSASGSDNAAFKRFTSENYGGLCGGRNCQPYIDFTYTPDTKPQLDAMYPANSSTTPTLTPELLAAATDAEGDPLTYQFSLYDLAGGPSLADSPVSSSRSWTVPAGKMKWGQSYAWSVVVSDGVVQSTPKVHVLTATPPQPLITSNMSQNSGRGIEPSIGNFTTQAVDAQIASVGPALSIQRSYNSRDSRQGSAFGLGWSSIFDAKVTVGPYWAMVTYPDGQEVVFGRNDDGTYASPPGRFASLRETAPGRFELTDKLGVKYRFSDRPSIWWTLPHPKLMSIEDTQGREVELKYYKGIHHIDPIIVTALQSKFYQYDSNGTRTAEWLGRKLDIGWTGTRVASVSTERADAADANSVSTWTYTYVGGHLTKVCSPTSTTACTQYQYGANGQYPGAVLDESPHTYLRLNEASGSTANSVATNGDTANGTYHEVELSRPGHPGSASTAVGFNGSSSWVQLPNKAAFSSADQTIAMWFKAPSGYNGVLFSASTEAMPAQAGAGWNPILYIGDDGKLRGEKWIGHIDPITTVDSVTDGQWHHVVLTVAGNTQTMYLDGTSVGTLTGTVQSQGEDNFHVGAGQWDWWNGSGGSTFGYFTGTIADFSFYTKALTPTQVATLRSAGAMTANWLYPTAALDAGPHTYLRLGDTAGPATIGEPTDVDDAITGAYHDVALAQAGPTGSLSTAAAFNGSSSWVELPDTPALKSAHQTVAMWFKTAPGGSGVLYSASTQALPQQAGSGWNPVLYIGTDGKLRGEMWNGGVNPITTEGTVNDGNWHHVALSVAGSTQTLYLDGVQVGEPLQGTVQSQGENHFYLGAGQWDWWHGNGGSTFGYFNGSIADFSFYTKPLTGVQIKGMRDAGTGPSAPLARVVLPSGHTQAQVVYDNSGIVTEVIDENSAKWIVSPAVVTGSDAVYTASVLAGAPKNYWRLGDTGTPSTAKNEINGGTASFSSVTLGEPGPFQGMTNPPTAAKFNGTSSYLKLPPDDYPHHGTNSVSMWFKTEPDSTAGGVLYSYQGTALPDTSAPNYMPGLYVGTDGKLRGEFWHGSFNPITSAKKVNDGNWHHVVLSASTTSQSMYLDGELVSNAGGNVGGEGTMHIYIGAGKWAGYPSTAGEAGYFKGWIAEFAFYQRELTAGDASAQFGAYRKTTGAPMRSVTVKDPGLFNTTYRYDALNGRRLIEKIDAAQGKTVYGYDSGGFLRSTTDPNGNMTVNGHDVRGNVVSQMSCQDQSAIRCTTIYYTYFPDATTKVLTPDPRNDLVLTVRDGRSASKDDNNYLTTFVYDTKGNRTEVVDPYGRRVRTVYTDGSGGIPAGLPKQVISPSGGESFAGYFPDGDLKETLDSAGQKVEYTYDGHGRIASQKVTASEILTTTYAYDKLGRRTVQTDPPVVNRITSATHTKVTETTYDLDGNTIKEEIRDSTGGDANRITSYVYTGTHLTKVIDPLLKQTQLEYDRFGRLSKQIDPNGVAVQTEYTKLGSLEATTILGYTGDPNNPQAPIDLPLETRQYDAAGRLAAVTDAKGYRTEYDYTDNGLLSTAVRHDPTPGAEKTFTLEANTYDDGGNLKKQVTRNGATITEVTTDRAGRTSETLLDPAGVKRKTTYTYTPESDVRSITITDGSTGSQTTDLVYDLAGRQVSQTIRGSGAGATGPAGWWKLDNFTGLTTLDSTTADRHATVSGNVSWPGEGEGRFDGGWVATSGPVLDTNQSFTISAWAKVADTGVGGTIVGQDANWRSGFELYYAGGDNWGFVKPYGDGNWGGAWVGGATPTNIDSWMHLVAVYDRAAGVAKLYVNGTLLDTQTAYDQFAATGALTIGRGKYGGAASAGYDGLIDNVQVYQHAVSTAEISALLGKGRTGGSLSTDVSTSWAYDKGGLPVSETNGNGQITEFEYDAAGRRTLIKSPGITAEEFGTPAVPGVIPMSWVGYDTFGDTDRTKDPKGRIVTYVRDANGRVTETRLPTDNGLTPIYKTAYDNIGRVLETEDPRQKKTTYVYDQLGRQAKVTTRDGGQSKYTYDLLGHPLSVKDAFGAEVRATYDYLGRMADRTEVVRQPTYAEHQTTYTYHSSGQLKDALSPGGVQAQYGYNGAGELSTVLDQIGTTTHYGYDFAGRRISATPKVGSAQVGVKKTVEFDVAGRAVAQREYAIGATNPTASRSATYDSVGNMLTATDFRNFTTQFSYDATGLLTQQVEPVSATDSITTMYGYDIGGAPTRFTDGRNNQFWTTYNNWGLLDKTFEPATAAFPSLADRTFFTTYDIAGRAVTQAAPGGVSTSYTYDDMDRVTRITGAGAEATTADRTFGYDAAGRVTSLSGSGGTNTLAYDDRGLLLSATGPSGDSSFEYDPDGRMKKRVDAVGTTQYEYLAGRLTSMSNTDTGIQNVYTYNQLGQLKTINYGSNERTLGYDELDRLITDVLKTAGGAEVGKITYGWDANSNLTSKNTTGIGGGGTTNTYTYDRANRLKSWYNGYDNTLYAYDKSGNRVQAGGRTFTYDERNQLLASPSQGTTYQYTARGTLRSSTTGTVTLNTLSDAFGQVSRQYSSATAYSEYTYDGLGRAIKPGFSYTGVGNDLASDGVATYTRDPMGGVVGVKQGTAKSNAWTDLHSDIVGQFTATSTTLTGSATYDPLGKVVQTSGMIGNLGYQSEWTELSTGRVNMHARWYNPETGQFDSRDSWSLSPSPASANANRFAYANQNPLTGTDPTGHENLCDNDGSPDCAPPPIDDNDPLFVTETEVPVTPPGGVKKQVDDGQCSGVFDCFWEGLKSTFSISMDDIFAIWNAIKNLGESFKGLEREAEGWGQKIRKMINDPLWLPQWATTTAGWICVVTGACEIINDCASLSAKCMYHVGAAVGEAILGLLTAGAAAAGLKIIDRVRDLAKKLLNKRDGKDENGNPIGSSSPSTMDSTTNWDIKKANIEDRLDNDPKKPDPKKPEPNKPPKDNKPKKNEPPKKDENSGCSGHSFDAATPVLMADGSAKPIEDIQVGDEVLSTDPETGESTSQPVTQLHLNLDEDLIDVVVSPQPVAVVQTAGEGNGDRSTRGPTATLHTTQHHPFWDATSKSWVNAADLEPGESTLVGPDGQIQYVAAIQIVHGFKFMHDLTVGTIHTYYVVVGPKPVLVHNNDCKKTAVFGVHDVSEKLASDLRLANPGRTFETYNDPKLRAVAPGEFRPAWMNRVTDAVNDPDAYDIAISLDGLGRYGDNLSDIFRNAVAEGGKLDKRGWPQNCATCWELRRVAQAVMGGERQANSVTFFSGGAKIDFNPFD
ncbi:MAG TPA: hypothetical protein DGG94_01645 [Micromonosporaceae bacterium]|nr:hypothetical protein [Micromonosporaceae bacterium]HCU48531.1 hypothetical protein [Micromonosporaceae bacterium]